MTADEAALWRAVLDRPDDDLARLVYADYVEEHGRGPLAGFIRAQVRLANAPPGHADYPDAVEAQSLAVAAARGASSLPAPTLPDGVLFAGNVCEVEGDGYGAYERGFPAVAALDGFRFSHPQAIGRAVGRTLVKTTVRDVRFRYTSSAALEAVLAAPGADRLAGVGLSAPAVDADFAAAVGRLFDSPAADQLARLDVLDNPASAGAAALARAPMPRLARLALGRSSGAVNTAVGLAGAAWLPRLTHLDANCHARGLGLQLVGRAPGLRSLTARGLRSAPLSDVAQAQPDALPRLRELTLVGPEIGRDGGLALARWPLPPVAVLRLVDATVTAPGLAALLEAPWLAGCVELAVSGGRVAPLADALAGSALARTLRLLYLDGTAPDADELAALARPGAFPLLSTLSVKRPGGGDPAGLAGFAERWSGPGLHTLVLDGWQANTAGLQRLAANPAFASLRRLKLSRSKVPDAGAMRLFHSPHLARLAELDVSHNTLADKAAAALLAGVMPGLVLADLTTNRMHPDDRARLRERRPGVWA